jgi:hypothetical protein
MVHGARPALSAALLLASAAGATLTMFSFPQLDGQAAA